MINLLFFFITSLYSITFLSCSNTENDNPLALTESLSDKENKSSENLEIITEKSEYNFNEIKSGNYIFVLATIKNTSEDTFYTKLGDGFNTSLDQEYLSVAEGTDGYFERNISDNIWENLDLGFLVEGSRLVRILPQTEYQLTAGARYDEELEGKFRIKIEYYRSANTVDTLKDLSNIFYINK